MLKGPDWGSEGTGSTPGSAVGSCDPGLEMRNGVSKVTGQAKPDSQRDPRVCIPPAVTLCICVQQVMLKVPFVTLLVSMPQTLPVWTITEWADVVPHLTQVLSWERPVAAGFSNTGQWEQHRANTSGLQISDGFLSLPSHTLQMLPLGQGSCHNGSSRPACSDFGKNWASCWREGPQENTIPLGGAPG